MPAAKPGSTFRAADPFSETLELGSCLKNVVPVVVRGPEALDGRMEGDHGAGHVLAGGIGVKATINEIALGDQGSQPARVGASAGSRDAAVLGVESQATDGVDGRLDEDDGGQRASGEGEEAEIFLRTWGEPVPGALGGAAQFGADGLVFFSKEQENRIGSGVGVESAGLDQGIDQSRRKGPFTDEIVPDAPELGRVWRWYGQRRFWEPPAGFRRKGIGKGLAEPLDGLGKAKVVQVDHQVDGPAAAPAAVPVHEFGAGDREDPLGRVPLAMVVAVGLGSTPTEHRFQGDAADLVGAVPERLDSANYNSLAMPIKNTCEPVT